MQIASLSTEIQDNAHIIKIIHTRDKDSNQKAYTAPNNSVQIFGHNISHNITLIQMEHGITKLMKSKKPLYRTTLSNVYMYFQVYE